MMFYGDEKRRQILDTHGNTCDRYRE